MEINEAEIKRFPTQEINKPAEMLFWKDKQNWQNYFQEKEVRAKLIRLDTE